MAGSSVCSATRIIIFLATIIHAPNRALGACDSQGCQTRRMLDASLQMKLDNLIHNTTLLNEVVSLEANQTRGSQLLDIVIAHHNEWNEWHVKSFWEPFLKLPKIKELQPYVYIYCQNPALEKTRLQEMFGSVVVSGEIVSLENKGREGRVYLHHIVHNYDRLARHTLFSQDVAAERWQPVAPTLPRMQTLFSADTGVLALSEVYVTNCDESTWIDNAGTETHLMYETYAMITGRHCPREGFVGIFKGQFIASSKRIRGRSKTLYQEMLQLIEADRDHPVHRRHNAEFFKDAANPYIGHVYERAWSLLMDCHDPSTSPETWIDACRQCEGNEYTNCTVDACQCLDSNNPALDKPQNTISIHVHNSATNSSN